MKVYIVALIDGKYMVPVCNTVFKTERAAQQRCDAMSKEIQGVYHVLVADNWHKLEETE